MDASLYLRFKSIREHPTVALSGESADEVFGGYQQFFDPEAQRARTFPWLVRFAGHFGNDNSILAPGLTEALDLPRYIQDAHDTSVARIGRLDGESDRVKSPYPSTQHPEYTVKLQNNAREYLSSPGHPVFDIVNRDWLSGAVSAEAQITEASRHSLERALDLALWLDMYKPWLKLS